MRFVISGGGTAGHVNPALAVAQGLQTRGHEVFYAGTPSGMEARLVAANEIPYEAFSAAGFNRSKPWTLLTSGLKVARSTSKAQRWLSELKPDAVAGFGGYVSIPVGLAAVRLGIPLLIHEQNSALGMANRYLAKRAQAVALTYEAAASGLSTSGSIEVTGNPVRPSLKEATRASGRAFFGLPQDARVLFVFGGSLGALHLNKAVAQLAPQLLERKDLHVLHSTGQRDYTLIREQLVPLGLTRELGQIQASAVVAGDKPLSQETAEGSALSHGASEGEPLAHDATEGGSLSHDATPPPRWHLIEYCDRMGEALAASDLVLARAGATSLAEISALGIPALLVPFPYATDDHQTTNAQTLVAAGAARMVSDAELDEPIFAETLISLLDNPQERTRMAQASSALGAHDAAAALIDLLLRITSLAQ
ncbi:MAG: UDP-N-acetylglucosamine--N-acetylmuramyl-(pentapeptide) pyrophosphoryl-undecaprenol N-acetylglucosamine transferase [Coriobacteriales bacterium]|nr:UDP-N-acetylglucosamine--N-acetylmuramyl-(pentapeptide) pyrophosphoryl-undecaprenol N-acetylglucosamine transferase [Coriobacteriales bacterium]